MNGPHRVIFTRGGGRFGNQVLRFIHWAGWAQSRADIEVLNLSFWPYARHFAVWRQAPACIVPSWAGGWTNTVARVVTGVPRIRATWSGHQRVQRAVDWLGRHLPAWQAVALDDAAGETINLDAPVWIERVKRARVTTCSGWRFSAWRSVAEQADAIRPLFRLTDEIQSAADVCVSRLRREADRVIGVFIRQSDYSVWQNGRFCFSTTKYAEWMRGVAAFEKGRVAFLVASEDVQDRKAFAGLPVHFASGSANAGGHWIASWAELMRCDAILTPPSTFAATAAFVGKIPLWPVMSADQVMIPEQQIHDGLGGAAAHPVFSCSVQ